MASREQQVNATLMELADTLVQGYDLMEYVDRLLYRSISVTGATAGGVMITNGRDDLQLLASSDERAHTLELFELSRDEGPCLDSFRSAIPVVEGWLARAERWPEYSPAAVACGYQAVHAFPMRLRDTTIGALNLFKAEPGTFPSADSRTAQAFADMATIGILHQRTVVDARMLAAQLQTALNSRVVIEQAKGVVAERLACNPDEAYQAMRWHARTHNQPLRAVATAVVSGELVDQVTLPEVPASMQSPASSLEDRDPTGE